MRPPAVPIDTWKDRNDFLRTCVLFGLNARQVSELSLSTPQPMRALQHVYDKIEGQGLARLYKSKKVENRRKGDHNQQIIRVMMKLVGQAYEYGYAVSELMRDGVPCDGARFRPDIGLKVGERQFYVEIQLSKIQQTRWHEKMRNYLRLYRGIRQPFRVLFLVDRAHDVPRLREYARQVLEDRPQLNLFYFLTLAEFEYARDILKARVWYGAWHPKAKHALM